MIENEQWIFKIIIVQFYKLYIVVLSVDGD